MSSGGAVGPRYRGDPAAGSISLITPRRSRRWWRWSPSPICWDKPASRLPARTSRSRSSTASPTSCLRMTRRSMPLSRLWFSAQCPIRRARWPSCIACRAPAASCVSTSTSGLTAQRSRSPNGLWIDVLAARVRGVSYRSRHPRRDRRGGLRGRAAATDVGQPGAGRRVACDRPRALTLKPQHRQAGKPDDWAVVFTDEGTHHSA